MAIPSRSQKASVLGSSAIRYMVKFLFLKFTGGAEMGGIYLYATYTGPDSGIKMGRVESRRQSQYIVVGRGVGLAQCG
jgi:hypothetical protein